MSFGISVSDFITVGSLIADIVSSLREAGGSKSQYQEIFRELEGLERALSFLDRLQSSDANSRSIASIKYAALNCRRPLEQFLNQIRKYDNALGVWSKAGTIRSTADKLKWAYTQKDEIRKLQNYLNVHVGTINILLAEHGLERMDIASERSEWDQLQLQNRLKDTQKVIKRINSTGQAQAQAMAVANSTLGKLLQMVSSEVVVSLKSLSRMVSKVCVYTQQIYTVVLEIKSAIGPGDIRWTYFQAPLIIEDALGFKFPIPSEYDYDLLNTIIKHRFLEGPGSLDVSLGNYELFLARDSSQVISPQVRLLPGTSITMAILVGTTALSNRECPMPWCKSNRTTAAPGGGQICCECNVFFDKSSKKRRGFQDLLDGISQQSNEIRPGKRKSDYSHDASHGTQKGLKTNRGEYNMHLFRNVRWTVEPIPVKDAVGVEAQLSMQKPFKESQDKLIETIGRLQEHIDSITSNRKPDIEGERLRLQEGLNISKKCLAVCKEAFNQVSNQIYNEDYDQIIVANLADFFYVRRAPYSNLSTQLIGSVRCPDLDLYTNQYGGGYKP